MTKPGYRCKFLYKLLVFITSCYWVHLCPSSNCTFLRFSAIFCQFLWRNRAILVVSRLCHSFRMHYLELVTCCRISMVYLLLIFINILLFLSLLKNSCTCPMLILWGGGGGAKIAQNFGYTPIFGSWSPSYIKVHIEGHIIFFGAEDLKERTLSNL